MRTSSVTAVPTHVENQHAEGLDCMESGCVSLGANWRDGECEFMVWAPFAKRVEIHLVHGSRTVELEPMEKGYFRSQIQNLEPDSSYFFQLDRGNLRGDPASRFQPQGVFGPSRICDTSAFPWTDSQWRGI